MLKMGGGRCLCVAGLLVFILSAGLFLSACGGGGSAGDPAAGPGDQTPGDQVPGDQTPDDQGPGNQNPPPPQQQPPAVTVQFPFPSYTISEGQQANATVRLSADPERTVTIPIRVDTEASTAETGDYSLPASVTFASGETSKSISLTATDDTAYEPSEAVVLAFGRLPPRVFSGAQASTTVTITNNDDPDVTVSFGEASYSVAESGSVDVAVTLNADPERTVEIPFTVNSKSTAQDADYSGLPASLTFASGQTSKSISLTAKDDTADDDDETVIIAFGTLPPRVSPGTHFSTTVTITDNDDPDVTVSFGEASYSITEGGSVDVAVKLSADPERDVVIPVTVDTTNSTAMPEDYSVPANVTFASGDTTKNITVASTDDTAYEDSEDVVLGFGSLPEKVSTGTTSSTTVTIENNDPPDSCDDDGVIHVTGNYDAKKADPDPDPLGEGLFICGDSTVNFIRGGDGDDTIMGNNGSDTLQGRDGDDTINGGPGVDWVIYRTTHEDDKSELDAPSISLVDGTTTSDGYGGTDTLTSIEVVRCEGGTITPDTFTKIVGNDADNRLSCGTSRRNQIHGGAGDDTFEYSPGDNYYDGGEGTDTLNFSNINQPPGGTSHLTIALNLHESGDRQNFERDGDKYGGIGIQTHRIGGADNTHATYYAKLVGDNSTKGEGMTNIENIIGSGFNDELTGHAGPNRIDGQAGDDTLRGMGGADTLIGGAGGGTDTLYGGPGNDTYYADFLPAVQDTVEEAAGEGDNDILYYNLGPFSHRTSVVQAPGTTTPVNVETVYGTGHADTIRAADSGVTLYGGDGNDTLYGGAGDDTLWGQGGNDSFEGGAGDDTYYATSSEEGSIVDSGGSADTLYYTDKSAIAHGHTYNERNKGNTPPNIETVYGTGLNDRIRAPAIQGAQPGHDPITLVGGPGNDYLYGNYGKNVFVGCWGSNRYYSQTTGCNTCVHAPDDDFGNDFYVSAKGVGQDRIIDFYYEDNDTLYIVDYAGGHDGLTITKPHSVAILIGIAGSLKTVVVTTDDTTGHLDRLLAQFKDPDSGRIKFSTSDHPLCANSN